MQQVARAGLEALGEAGVGLHVSLLRILRQRADAEGKPRWQHAGNALGQPLLQGTIQFAARTAVGVDIEIEAGPTARPQVITARAGICPARSSTSRPVRTHRSRSSSPPSASMMSRGSRAPVNSVRLVDITGPSLSHASARVGGSSASAQRVP
ncbi:hypothetical protein AWV80_02230 [Cupriavidus sp. UYMU48A]|nr:hypothetical protein AWV80_02230 [Cupriavidus sp. UYMU48A]